MRVLQVNTVYKIKSTGRTCSEIEAAQIEKGHECCTAYGNGKKHMGDNTYRIDSRLEYLIHNILSRVFGWEGYFSFFATLRFIHFIKRYKPDIIHLRVLHGHYLNLPLLFKYLSKANIPVVQSLHDCWNFTGKCAYYSAIGCDHWQTECGNCPVFRQYPQSYFFDHTKKMRMHKEKWYRGIKNLTVVGVSQWVSEEAQKSFLKSANEITYIYNWIDMGVFHPYPNRDEIRNKYNIPTDKFVILGVSASWTEGTPRYEDFMKLSSMLSDDEILVLVGRNAEQFRGKQTVCISYVDSTVELAKLYSEADVYVHCSIEDTFGKVIAEAMATGTPAVVYDATACPELIKEKCGFVVPPRDVQAIRDRINIIKAEGKIQYSQACLDNVAENFNYEKNTDKLIALYSKIISDNH